MWNRRSWHFSSVVLLLLAFMLLSFRQPASAGETVKSFFVVAPRASEIKQTVFQGKDQLTYSVQTEFPATDVLDIIRTRLKRLGWKPLDEDWLNPGIPSSNVRGWTYFEDLASGPRTSVRAWQADWTNEAGDILIYILEYRCHEDLCSSTQDLHDLRVIAVRVPAELAKQMKQPTHRN